MIKYFLAFLLISFPCLTYGSEITTYEYRFKDATFLSLNEDETCEYDEHLNAGIALLPKDKELNKICWVWIENDGNKFALIFTPQKEYGETIPKQELTQKIINTDE
jgi:DNA invertase Pin-like site-specific DNA recombinase